MYERYMTQRYISDEDIDVYRQQRMFYSQVGITATQIMERWGGQFYGSTQLGYLRTFGDQNQTQVMTVPISVGYKQDLLFYNPMKWARQIEPLKLTLAEKKLATYLGMERTTDIELVIPTVVRNVHVDGAEAIQHARENNPQYLSSRQATTEARRNAERARVEKNFSVSLNASVGLNQVADRFADAYRHLLSQDMATVTLSVPLNDWGKRKHAYQAARSTMEAAERAEQESARDTELDVTLTVGDFNERQAIAETAREALTIAEDAYAQTLQRFIRGQADAYSLSVAQSHWQTARQNQIASVQNYWLTYYHLRRLTLFDYLHHKGLDLDDGQ
jgi:hypothetical protein